MFLQYASNFQNVTVFPQKKYVIIKENGEKMLDDRTKNTVRYYIPEQNELDLISELFSAFSDQTRLKILSALSISEMCVGDLADVISVNQTTVSHQLKYLRSKNLVQSKRHGKIIFYSLSGDTVSEILGVGLSQLGY